jgi:microcystin-dependent protein
MAMALWKPRRPVAAIASEPVERRGFIKRMLAFAAGGAVLAAANPRNAQADGDPFIGEIALVPYNFEPRGWAFCNGQILSIAQNTALFSLLGTTYGGNGQTTFALPDLRGRVPMHVGSSQGPGLSLYNLGEQGGAEAVTLLATQMPVHNHLENVSSANGTSDNPANGILGKNASGVPQYGAGPGNATMAAGAIANAGGSQPHENRQPYLGLNYIIALQGIFPSRN